MNYSRCKNSRILSSSIPGYQSAAVLPDKANFLGSMGTYHGLHPFRVWVQKVLPQVYDDSLSYQELIYKLMWYINTLIEDVTTCEENIALLQEAYNQLQDYVNNYFDNLDLTGELEQVLDAAINDGSLFSQLMDCIVLGSGLQQEITESTRTNTEVTTETIDDYPNCCCCCENCANCKYVGFKDGDKVVSTYTTTDKVVVTTIELNGDVFTTTQTTTETIRFYNVYSNVEAGTGITITPGSSKNPGTQVYSTDDSHIEDVARDLIVNGDEDIDNHIVNVVTTNEDVKEYIENVSSMYITEGNIEEYLTEVAQDAVNEEDILNFVYNDLSVKTGLQKSKSGNTINLASNLTEGTLIDISPASSLSSTGAQKISVDEDALLALIKKWLDDGTLTIPTSSVVDNSASPYCVTANNVDWIYASTTSGSTSGSDYGSYYSGGTILYIETNCGEDDSSSDYSAYHYFDTAGCGFALIELAGAGGGDNYINLYTGPTNTGTPIYSYHMPDGDPGGCYIISGITTDYLTIEFRTIDTVPLNGTGVSIGIHTICFYETLADAVSGSTSMSNTTIVDYINL